MAYRCMSSTKRIIYQRLGSHMQYFKIGAKIKIGYLKLRKALSLIYQMSYELSMCQQLYKTFSTL